MATNVVSTHLCMHDGGQVTQRQQCIDEAKPGRQICKQQTIAGARPESERLHEHDINTWLLTVATLALATPANSDAAAVQAS